MAHPNAPARTQTVEMYVGESLSSGDSGTWYTTYVDVPAGLDDAAKTKAAENALAEQLNADGVDAAFYGVYCLNADYLDDEDGADEVQ
jgi:hypothetical protein